VRLTESERTVSSELDLSLKLLSERLASCAICSVCSSCVDCWSCDTGVLTGNAWRQINRLTVGGVGSGAGRWTLRAASACVAAWGCSFVRGGAYQPSCRSELACSQGVGAKSAQIARFFATLFTLRATGSAKNGTKEHTRLRKTAESFASDYYRVHRCNRVS